MREPAGRAGGELRGERRMSGGGAAVSPVAARVRSVRGHILGVAVSLGQLPDLEIARAWPSLTRCGQDARRKQMISRRVPGLMVRHVITEMEDAMQSHDGATWEHDLAITYRRTG